MRLKYNIFKVLFITLAMLVFSSCEETLDTSVNVPDGILVDITSNTSPKSGYEIDPQAGTCERRIFERNNFRRNDRFTIIDKTENVLRREWTFTDPSNAEIGEVIPNLQFENDEGELSEVIEGTVYSDLNEVSLYATPQETPELRANDNTGLRNILVRLFVEFTNNRVEFRDVRLSIYAEQRYRETQSECEAKEIQ